LLDSLLQEIIHNVDRTVVASTSAATKRAGQ